MLPLSANLFPFLRHSSTTDTHYPTTLNTTLEDTPVDRTLPSTYFPCNPNFTLLTHLILKRIFPTPIKTEREKTENITPYLLSQNIVSKLSHRLKKKCRLAWIREYVLRIERASYQAKNSQIGCGRPWGLLPWRASASRYSSVNWAQIRGNTHIQSIGFCIFKNDTKDASGPINILHAIEEIATTRHL